MDILQAFINVLNPTTLLFIFLGVTLGELVGVLPGISSPAAVALLLPTTYALAPINGLAMLAGIWYGSSYGGIITSVLLNIPGEGDSVISTLDGYQMAKQGRGSLALGVSAFGGFIAGTIALIALQFVGPSVAKLAVRFGPQEYFGLMFFGLALVSWLSGKSILKGMVSCVLGLLIGTVGGDIVSGESRLTFDQNVLLDGIGFVPVVVGLFGLGEVLHTVGEQLDVSGKTHFSFRGLFPRKGEWSPSIWSTLRGTVMGFVAGAIPGVGPTNATFIEYAVEKGLSKTPEKFGTGALEGVAGPGAAGHAGTIAGMVPLLSLGIPASGTAAILMGGFIIHGLFPGPLLYREHPDIVWGLIASLYIGNIMLLLMNTLLIPFLVWIVEMARPYIAPLIGVLTLIGAFCLNNNPFDIWLAICFGILGYIFRIGGFPLAPMVIALVLGRKAETGLRQSLQMSGGDFSVFFTRPVSAALIALAVMVLLVPIVSPWIRRLRSRA
ncbi:MAG: tripartite tricarboxylate transporter permease [Syntrophales bacterium]